MLLRAMKKSKLSKGCREIIRAQKGVSGQMGDNTNKNLARAMAKTWSKTQMVTRRRISRVIWEWKTRQVF